MKLVHAIGWYFPESLGGTEVYVAALAARMGAAGVHVSVAAPLKGISGPRSYQHAGIEVFRFPAPEHPTRDECQSRVPTRGAELFTAWLAEKRPDLLHVHTLTTGLGIFELQAARRLGAKIVVTNHLGSLGYLCQRGTMMRWGEALCDGVAAPLKCAACQLQARGIPKALAYAIAALNSPIDGMAARLPGAAGTAFGMAPLIRHNLRLQRDIFAVVDRFVVLNRWALEVLVANGMPREKIGLNYLGAGHAGATPKPGPAQTPTARPVRFGYVGRFADIKGVFELAAAVKGLPAGIPFLLEFRGPTSDHESAHVLAKLRQMLAADPRVRFAEAVAPEQVPELLKTYDALLVPSIGLESGPTVMIEAHAVGTPVIGTRIGAMPEIITDGVNGRLLPPGDWRALAGVLREVAMDPAQTIDRWRQALPPARSMDQVTADYLSLYAGLGCYVERLTQAALADSGAGVVWKKAEDQGEL